MSNLNTDTNAANFERLKAIADTAVKHSGGRLRLAFNEEDETEDSQPDAAHFLKLDGKRIGRDLELYRLMAKVSNWQAAVADFAEVVLSLRSRLPEAYASAAAGMIELGKEIYPEGIQDEWRSIFKP